MGNSRKTTPQILELYGMNSSDPRVKDRLVDHLCPFIGQTCKKHLRGSSNPTGVCVVSQGATKTGVIVCPNRLYGDNHAILRLAAVESFGGMRFIIGGDVDSLRNDLQSKATDACVAFGHSSGHEIQIPSRAKMSLDWVIQRYDAKHKPKDFIAVEVQSMDTTGNYRANLEGWIRHHNGSTRPIPPSKHGINWANVHKRLLPQLIRKGLILTTMPNFQGLFFMVPDNVYDRFEHVLEEVPEQGRLGPDIMSIRTFTTDNTTSSGVRTVRSMNYLIKDVAAAHYGRPDEKAVSGLANTLKTIL